VVLSLYAARRGSARLDHRRLRHWRRWRNHFQEVLKKMLKHSLSLFTCLAVVLLLSGCATVPEGRPTTLKQAEKPVWSMKDTNGQLAVSVSPAGKSLRLAGSAGLVVGTTVDAAVNAKYRGKIKELLDGYDTGKALDEAFAKRLNESTDGALTRVSPLSTSAGYSNRREAEAVRYTGFGRKGHDLLFELRTTHGVYSHRGILAITMDGKLRLLPEGKRVWDASILVDAGPVLANGKLGDPTSRFAPAIKGARLTVQKGMLDKWTGGGSLQAEYEQAVEAAASALLCALGLVQEPLGEYHLGKSAMNEKDFKVAEAHFKRALQLDPGYLDAKNALAVNRAHQDDIDGAIAAAQALADAAPDYAPAQFNLAWWKVVEKGDTDAGGKNYRRALALGLPPASKVEKILDGDA
jgi:tetratricopeptide (TPR) repeat protein